LQVGLCVALQAQAAGQAAQQAAAVCWWASWRVPVHVGTPPFPRPGCLSHATPTQACHTQRQLKSLQAHMCAMLPAESPQSSLIRGCTVSHRLTSGAGQGLPGLGLQRLGDFENFVRPTSTGSTSPWPATSISLSATAASGSLESARLPTTKPSRSRARHSQPRRWAAIWESPVCTMRRIHWQQAAENQEHTKQL
jgi:hypothetical protein